MYLYISSRTVISSQFLCLQSSFCVRRRDVLFRGPEVLVYSDAPETDIEEHVDDQEADLSQFVGPLRLSKRMRPARLKPLLWCRRRRVARRIGLCRTRCHVDNLVPNARHHRPECTFVEAYEWYSRKFNMGIANLLFSALSMWR